MCSGLPGYSKMHSPCSLSPCSLGIREGILHALFQVPDSSTSKSSRRKFKPYEASLGNFLSWNAAGPKEVSIPCFEKHIACSLKFAV